MSLASGHCKWNQGGTPELQGQLRNEGATAVAQEAKIAREARYCSSLDVESQPLVKSKWQRDDVTSANILSWEQQHTWGRLGYGQGGIQRL